MKTGKGANVTFSDLNAWYRLISGWERNSNPSHAKGAILSERALP